MADERQARPGATATVVRTAAPPDVPLLLELFRELAEYEHLEGELHATHELLHDALFGPIPAASALIAEHGADVAGYAVFYPHLLELPRDPGRLARGPVRAPSASRRRRRARALSQLWRHACANAAASDWNGRRSTGTSSPSASTGASARRRWTRGSRTGWSARSSSGSPGNPRRCRSARVQGVFAESRVAVCARR